MTRDISAPLTVGDIRITPATGEIRNSHGMSVRLSPVNMRILEHLANRPGQVVLRSELFDLVWKNQSVSDDALTRCISDIRSDLARLSDGIKFIETIPKRGYRWNTVNGRSSPDSSPMVPRRLGHPASIFQRLRPFSSNSTSLFWVRRALIYIVALVITASVGTWLVGMFSPPGPPIVVVMPTQAAPAQRDLAATIEQQISQYVANLDQVDLLSKTAAHSRAIDPFSHFYHEFGVRWLIESELHIYSEQTTITIGLVDARAGIVLFQFADQLPPGERPDASDFDHILEPLRIFVQSQSDL